MDISLQFTNIGPKDKLAALHMIAQHNAPIVAENARKAALTPPQAASPLLPSGTAAEIKASYETVLKAVLQSAHASYIRQEAEASGVGNPSFRQALENATQAQRDAALAALTS